MDMRELKALELAARARITWDGEAWSVPSQSGNGAYRVSISRRARRQAARPADGHGRAAEAQDLPAGLAEVRPCPDDRKGPLPRTAVRPVRRDRRAAAPREGGQADSDEGPCLRQRLQ